MTSSISVQQLSHALQEDPALALIDVREPAEYNLAHIAGSCSLPRRLIEFRLHGLVPFRGARIIVCDDDGRRAALAASTLAAMGYTNIAVLHGGLNRWVTEGQDTEWGVNVPSKDFGERVLHEQAIPEVTPDELDARLRRGERLILLDSRTPEEHQRACIPGSRSMPGAELGLRIWEILKEQPDVPVIVHCAGRTRSIVGAGTLRRLGIPQVYALKNGTMGWELAGLSLETGSERLQLPDVSPESRARAEASAREVARQDGVSFLSIEGLQELMRRATSENVYLIDVRTREEYAEGHIPGFQWVPGGQAVQATDSYVPIRAAPVVLACDGFVRAAMTGSWFRQMGFANVSVLDGGVTAWNDAGLSLEAGPNQNVPFGYGAALARVASITPSALQQRLADSDTATIFVGTSEEYVQGHIAGSRWLSRSWLELQAGEAIPAKRGLIVTCPDGRASVLASATLLDLGYEDVNVLEGGIAAWRSQDLPLEAGLAGVASAPDDVLPARRSYAEMLNYLRWEEQLGEKYRA